MSSDARLAAPVVVGDLLADLRQIDRIARRCISWYIAWLDDPGEALKESRSAILEKVAEAAAGEEVTVHDLFTAGKVALRWTAKAEAKEDGSRAAMYWDAPVRSPHGGLRLAPQASDSMEDRIVERIALREVFTSLPTEEQTLLLTYAAHDDVHAAASHMGVHVDTFRTRLRAARGLFLETWFDWEQAPNLPKLSYHKTLGTHCGRGHEFTPENTGYQRGRRSSVQNKRYCKACRNARSARSRGGNPHIPEEN